MEPDLLLVVGSILVVEAVQLEEVVGILGNLEVVITYLVDLQEEDSSQEVEADTQAVLVGDKYLVEDSNLEEAIVQLEL